VVVAVVVVVVVGVGACAWVLPMPLPLRLHRAACTAGWATGGIGALVPLVLLSSLECRLACGVWRSCSQCTPKSVARDGAGQREGVRPPAMCSTELMTNDSQYSTQHTYGQARILCSLNCPVLRVLRHCRMAARASPVQ
jgi:hypothetical protein